MQEDDEAVGALLAQDYKKAQRMFSAAVSRQFVLGRELVDRRERLGAAAFAAWMKRYCAEIPLEHAELLMNYALSSRLAEKVDAVLDSPECDDE